MAYSELDRTYVRHFVGYGSIFLQSEPRLESAITATQSLADKGSRPDSSTENYIKGLIYGSAAVCTPLTPVGVTQGPLPQNVAFATPAVPGLLALEQQCSAMWGFTFAAKADEATVDTFRGVVQLRIEGGRLCHALARMLGMKGVRANVFAPGPTIMDDNPFAYDNPEHWRGGP
jgi:hypothetical protein